eukprot:TRINITY_DN10172_c0_g1_i3.p1 TRINITY_DN10172_c0_g1~~TRINITY_DN10172_c0_g1_i3.p1  ORF type:complete len:414 (+),score=63.03 TRINITY_DN10172_c0_g1_i3:22-1242(+)
MDESSRTRDFPDTFLKWLKDNDIPIEAYKVNLPRHIRLSKESNIAKKDLEEAFKCEIKPVQWLPSFFTLPPDAKLAGNRLYEEGMVHGVDVSSGAAVYALQAEAGHHVLDVCCAPGAKLCMLADQVGDLGSVTGIDINRERLAACRNLLLKYKCHRVRLLLGDGTMLTNGVPSWLGRRTTPSTTAPAPKQAKREARPRPSPAELAAMDADRRRRRQLPKKDRKHLLGDMFFASADLHEVYRSESEGEGPSRRATAKADAATVNPHDVQGDLYDRVIVDAECTHDGSTKHISKFDTWGWSSFERRFFDPERIAGLQTLQRGLILRGFDMLKPGGRMVYSTCSFAKRQNEDIVAWLLARRPQAQLVSADIPCEANYTVCAPPLQHCIKFDPLYSGTSGLFVATILKVL